VLGDSVEGEVGEPRRGRGREATDSSAGDSAIDGIAGGRWLLSIFR